MKILDMLVEMVRVVHVAAAKVARNDRDSARETQMALRLAGACGYLQPAEAGAAVSEVDAVIRVLWTLAYRR